ncbi:MAG: response regulator, partial [Gammaproteobacteria bacterium]
MTHCNTKSLQRPRHIIRRSASVAALSAALTVGLPQPAYAGDVISPPVPTNLEVPPGNEAFLVGYAVGTQNYVCLPSGPGFAWVLFGPGIAMPAPHILGVDDDPAIRQLIADYLTENGFLVSTAADGKAMRQRLTQGPVDLVVLDIRLGQEDGMVLARELRATSEVPIIMLTGQREEADRVMGLELGADDYLTKPFSPRELLARIRAVLRRAQG